MGPCHPNIGPFTLLSPAPVEEFGGGLRRLWFQLDNWCYSANMNANASRYRYDDLDVILFHIY